MGVIVAIGGGELRRLETLAIDEAIVNMTGKARPRALFIPTASHDAKSYIETFNHVYGELLHCDVDVLCLVTSELDEQTISQKIKHADLIYVGGGDTAFMLTLWKQHAVDQHLIQAYEAGTLLCGLSAGAICWFESGWSDSESFINPDDWSYAPISGLGLIQGTVCVHYNEEGRASFDSFINTQSTIGYGIENNVAYVVENHKTYLLKSNEHMQAYQIQHGVWHKL